MQVGLTKFVTLEWKWDELQQEGDRYVQAREYAEGEIEKAARIAERPETARYLFEKCGVCGLHL